MSQLDQNKETTDKGAQAPLSTSAPSNNIQEHDHPYIHQDLNLSHGHYSSAGIKQRNDDTITVHIPEEPQLTTKGAVFLIADGVSTAEMGQEASQICGNEFIKLYYHTPELWSIKKSALNALIALNRQLYAKNREFTEPARGYATTLSLIIVKSHTAHIFHIGDSRIYMLRDNIFSMLTTDHSELNNESYALTRAMGIDVTLQIDYKTVALQEGDRFLFSTDGVHDFLSNDAIQKTIEKYSPNFTRCCQKLAEKALEAESNDNISCLLIQTTELAEKRIDDLQHVLVPQPFPPPLSVGQKLDGYRVIKEMHASNRSQVYLVEDEETGEKLAMKTPSVNFDDDQSYIDRFCLEEWVGRRINNEHIVKVITPKRHKSFLYYLMEYVEGISLQTWIERNYYPRGGQVLKIAQQIAAGIESLHDNEIVHRDLKPGNIMIDNNGKVKIVDFGSIYIASIAEIQTSLDQNELLGTIHYTAPEYRLGKPAHAKMDQFSLGIIIYEMLTHNSPYGNNFLKAQKEKDFKRLRYTLSFKYNAEIPIWFDAALRRATETNPADRYDSLSDFAHDLGNPNPEYLTKEYIQQLEQTLPTINLFWGLSFMWAGSLLLAALVFMM